MIRINLLPVTAAKRTSAPRGEGQTFVLVLVALALVEAAGLYMWYSSVDEQAAQASAEARRSEKKVKELEQAKRQLEDREKKKLELSRQNIIFEQLKTGQSGPPEMLQWMTYVLTPREDNLYNRDEIKAQEAAGWAPSWNTDSVWVTEFKQDGREVTIKGLGKTRADVAEFVRRLASSVYFVEPDLPEVKAVKDEVFPQVTLQKFEVPVIVNYNQDGVFKMAADDIPEPLQKYVRRPAPKPAAKPGAHKGKAAAKKGKG